MFVHRMHAEAEDRVMVDCDWYEHVESEETSEELERQGIWLPQVVRNYNFDRCRIAFLSECAPYNIVMLPHVPSDPNCTVFDICDPHRKRGRGI